MTTFLIITPPAFGHLIPSLALADRIARHGYKVLLAVSQFVLPYAREKGSLTPDLENKINIIGLEDGIPSGTPESEAFRMAFSRSDGNAYLQPFLQGLRLNVENSSENLVLAVIADTFYAKPAAAWLDKEIPIYLFNPFTIASLNQFLRITANTPVDDAIDANSMLPFLMVDPPGKTQRPIGNRVKQRGLSVSENLKRIKGILVNSFREAESEALGETESNAAAFHLEVYCVGPLLGWENHVAHNVVRWLDKFPPATVIYATFGSTTTRETDRIQHLGKALLMLGRPFVLSLKQEHQKFLPVGLQSERQDSLTVDWVPQKAVLAHPAVQAFITHCGWNSTEEGIFYGKPIVAWPIFGDQLGNALWVERIGVGKCVLDGEARCSMPSRKTLVQPQVIVDAVNEVTKGDCVGNAKEWSKKMRQVAGMGSSSDTELVRFLRSN